MIVFSSVKRWAYKSRHSVYVLTYHLVLVTKYRKACITEEIGEFLVTEAARILKLKEGELLEGNHDQDHIHLLISMPPSIHMSQFIASLKNTLARLVRKHYGEELKKDHWGDSFWSDSFFFLTTGGASPDTVREYIEGQGKPKRTYTKRKNRTD